MKKKILSLLAMTAVVTACVASLASCNSKVEGAGEDFEVLSLDDLKGETVEVEFWHSFGHDITEELTTLVDGFEAEMKEQGYDIQVNLTSVGGGYDGLRENVNLGTQSGNVPTMLLGYPDHFADYIDSGILLSLDDYINSSDPNIALEGVTSTSNDFITSYWEENQLTFKDGTVHTAGIPFNKSTEIMVYNASVVDPILEELGYLDEGDTWQNPTWEEVFAVSQKILDMESSSGVSWTYSGATYTARDYSYPVFVDSEANFFITTSHQWSEDGTDKYTTLEGTTGYVVANNETTKTAMEYFLGKATSGLFHFPAKVSQSYGSNLLTNLRSFISIGSTAGIRNNESTKYELKATGIPQKGYSSSDHPSVIQQGTNLAILTSNSNNKTRLAAWLLIRYLTNAENTESFSIATGYMPVRTSAVNSTTYQAFLAATDDVFDGSASKAINAAFSQKAYFYTDATFTGSSIVRDNVETLVQDMFIYNKSYDTAMSSFYTTLQSLQINTR